MKWNNKAVLVTGGCGHIGSAVVKGLIARDAEKIIILDNFSAYKFNQLKVFCRDFIDNPRVMIVKGDIVNSKLLKKILQDVDIVFHLAAYADVAATIYNPDEDFRSNIIGTYNILKLSLDLNIEKVVFASSAAVYGNKPWNGNNPPVFKEDLCPSPISTYANSKLWGETQARLFYQLYGLKTVSLRYFSVYGPFQIPKPKSHSWVIAIFLMKAIRGKPLTVFDGNQVRDFTYVDDIAEATIRAAELYGIEGEAINVGTGKPTRIIDLAYMIKNIVENSLKKNVKIEVIPNRPKGDPSGGYADTSKLVKLLGFKPRVDLQTGLQRTLSWYLANKDSIPSWI